MPIARFRGRSVSTSAPTARPGLNGWSVVIGCFLGLSVSTAPTFLMSFGVFIGPIADDFGWTRGEMSVAFSIASLMLVLMTPLAGYLLDRLGADRLIVAGYIGLPIVFVALGTLLTSYPAFLMIAALVGVAGCVCSPLTYLSLLPRLFDRHLGLSISLAVCGLGVGQAVMPLLVQNFITALGWRNAWAAMAGVIAVIGLGSYALFIRHRVPAAGGPRGAADADGIAFAEIARTPAFWGLGLAFLFVSTAISGTGVHLIPLLSDLGYTGSAAAGVAAVFGIASIAGRLAAGVMLDRLSTTVPVLLFFGGLVVGLAMLGAGWGGAAPYVATALVGASLGAETDMLPFILRRRFGMRAFGRAYGIGFTLVQFGPVIGPLTMGVAFDRSESYAPALAVFAGMTIAATVLLILSASNRPRSAGSGCPSEYTSSV